MQEGSKTRMQGRVLTRETGKPCFAFEASITYTAFVIIMHFRSSLLVCFMQATVTFIYNRRSLTLMIARLSTPSARNANQ